MSSLFQDRTLVTVARAAQMLRLTRWGVHWLVRQRELTPLRAEGMKGAQLLFFKGQVRQLLVERADRRSRRPPARWTPGSQLEFVWPVEAVKPAPWRLIKPVMAKAQLSLKRQLEIEGRAKARLHDRGVKHVRSRKESRHVA